MLNVSVDKKRSAIKIELASHVLRNFPGQLQLEGAVCIGIPKLMQLGAKVRATIKIQVVVVFKYVGWSYPISCL